MKKKKFAGVTVLIVLALFKLVTLPVYAEAADYQETNTDMEETSAECQVIYKSTYDFSEEIPKYPELEVSASGYEGVYDGKAHGIAVSCKIAGAAILYSTDGRTFTTKKPVYTNAGTYVTYYKAEKEGYAVTIGSATVKIKEAVIDFASYDYSGPYDGRKHGIDLSVQTGGCKVLYSEDGMNFTSKKPEYTEPGTYVVYYKILKDNYATVTGSSTVTIKAKDDIVSNNNQNNNSADGNTDAGSFKVQTGDESHIFIYGAMLTASIFGLVKNRGRKEKRKL